MAIVFSTILGFYCLLLMVMLYGWVLIRRMNTPVKGAGNQGISIIIAVRNERENIQTLLQSLSTIAYPADKYEVIIVNDHSDDGTKELVYSLIGNFANMKMIELDEGMEGKKQALALGIRHAKFDIIATTDADCRFSKNWLLCISYYFDDPGCKMVSGAVKLTTGKSIFSRLQGVEFISLVGSGAAAIGLGHPVMCNGANLAYRKDVFKEVSGFNDNIHIASGDDEFLMRKVFRRYPDGIRFLNFYEAVVTSHPQATVKGFFHQRLRWAGKWRHNVDPATRTLAVFILASHVSFIGLISLNTIHINGTLGIILIKIFLEGTLLYWISRFLDRRFDIIAFLVLQFLYPIYVTVIGLSSLMTGYQWKSRNYPRT